MARGSGGGGSGGGVTHTGVEMLGGGGGIDSRGKTTIIKKYFVTSAGELETAPVVSGYHATNISYSRLNDTAYEQSVTYEAQSDLSGSGTTVYLENGVKGTFEMFCSFETVAIALHPRIDSLKKKYQGQPDEQTVTFPYYYIDGTASALSSSTPTKNPMHGVTHYKKPTMILRHTYFAKNPGGQIWDVTGRITDKLPARLPLPKGEIDDEGQEIKPQWMMQAPSVSRQGEAWQIVQEYVLLDAKVADGLFIKGPTPGV